jgi:uncharacterized protein (DUF1778 family)
MSVNLTYNSDDNGDIEIMGPTMRTARLEARISPDALAAVRRAAELQGRSVSDFVVAAAQSAAQKTIEDAQIIRLSIEDQRAFASAIIDPPPPTDGLIRAAKTHRSLIRE